VHIGLVSIPVNQLDGMDVRAEVESEELIKKQRVANYPQHARSVTTARCSPHGHNEYPQSE
jgi:hypothetical protein